MANKTRVEKHKKEFQDMMEKAFKGEGEEGSMSGLRERTVPKPDLRKVMNAVNQQGRPNANSQIPR